MENHRNSGNKASRPKSAPEPVLFKKSQRWKKIMNKEVFDKISRQFKEIDEQLHLIHALNQQGRTYFVIANDAIMLAYKLFFMNKIKQFLKNSMAQETIQLSININKKQQRYFKILVRNVNKKTKNPYRSALEYEFYEDILEVRNNNEDILGSAFGTKTIILTKKSNVTSQLVTDINNIKITNPESDSDDDDDEDHKLVDIAESDVKIPDLPESETTITQDKVLNNVHRLDIVPKQIKIIPSVVTPDATRIRPNVVPNIMTNVATQSAILLSAIRGSADGSTVSKNDKYYRTDSKNLRRETRESYGDGSSIFDGVKKKGLVDSSKHAGENVFIGNTDKSDGFMSDDNQMKRLDDNNETVEVTYIVCDAVEYCKLD